MIVDPFYVHLTINGVDYGKRSEPSVCLIRDDDGSPLLVYDAEIYQAFPIDGEIEEKLPFDVSRFVLFYRGLFRTVSPAFPGVFVDLADFYSSDWDNWAVS